VCGFCGLIDLKYCLNQRAPDILWNMTKTLNHRGPDEMNMWHNRKVGLGHTRLKVIDLEASRQPMKDPSNRFILVYNGEIYNYLQLRRELQSSGIHFYTNGDTEVVLNAFMHWGPKCLEKFNGMFAFALWDSEEQTLFLARDRMGQKPLFYYSDDRFFIFGSEIKSILSVPEIELKIDEIALDEYFKYGFISSPRTIYKKIKKLPPAHYLIFQEQNFSVHRYWKIPTPTSSPTITLMDGARILAHKLEKAVRLRLISDVPLGAFLSGGLDSSAIVALMARNKTHIKTFCIGFGEPSYDESSHARRVSEYLGTTHTEYRLEDYEVETLLPKLVNHFDEPFADSSALPTYHLSRITRQNVTVALSGDGGDELFAGYNRYVARRLAYYYNKLPEFLRDKFLNKFLSMFPENSKYYAKSVIKKAKLFVSMASRIDQDPLEVLPVVFSEQDRNKLLTRDFIDQLRRSQKTEGDEIRNISENFRFLDEISHMMWVDLHTYLPDDIFVKVDRMSMAHSLEVRSPFMDYEVVEFICSLPIEYKLKGITTKYILRAAMNEALPRIVLERSKQGFSVPLAVWFKNKLSNLSREYMLSKGTAELLNLERIKQLLAEHQEGKKDNSHRLWTLLIFCKWWNEYC